MCRSACAEHIQYLDADIHIQKDSSVYITESYVYDFEASNRYGFYRNIPLSYSSGGKNYSVDFHLLNVTNSEGDVLRSKVSAHDDAVTITVGDPRVAVSGRRIYKIHYVLRRGLHFFNGIPEFIWSVTGAECPVPISRAVVRVYTPGNIPFNSIKTNAYIGTPDNTGNLTVTDGNNNIQIMATKLNPGDDLTVSLGFPQGSIAPPKVFKQLAYWLSDWWPALLLPLFTGFSVGVIWWHFGRDAKNPDGSVATWDPPTDLSPAEVGTLYDERCDMQDIVATLIDLAARGHLTIKESAVQMGVTTRSAHETIVYVFTKTDPPTEDVALRAYERNLLHFIFGPGADAGSKRSLHELENKFFQRIPELREQIYDAMHQEGYFMQNPENVRQNCTGLALFFCLVGMLLILASSNETTILPWGIGVVISAAVIGCFAYAMPARTRKGVEALRRSLNFARFVNSVEPRRADLMIAEDPEIFGRLLPYALVLGVADKWAEEFRSVIKVQPSWYELKEDSNGDFSASKFVVALGTGMRVMAETMQSEPPGASPKLDVTTGDVID